MSDIDDLIEDLKRRRDELRVQINLASKEVQDEWRELEVKMKDFRARAELDKTGEGIGDAMAQLGQMYLEKSGAIDGEGSRATH